MIRIVLHSLSLLLLLSYPTYAEIKRFDINSLNVIQHSYQGQPFLLILWSHDCLPCLEEIMYLSVLNAQSRLKNIVLVNTDGISELENVEKILWAQQLITLDNWLFTNPNIEKLRYSIDPEWTGELPRSYFYSKDHNRIGKSGYLSPETLRDWQKNYNSQIKMILPPEESS